MLTLRRISERDYSEALCIAAKINYQDGMAYIPGNLAELALDREQWPEAERLAARRSACPRSSAGRNWWDQTTIASP